MRDYKTEEPVHWFRVFLAFVLLVGCVSFIWGNSILSREQSSKLSMAFANFVERALRMVSNGENPVFRYLLANIRKVAHAVEFFVLGSVSIAILQLLNRVNIHMLLHAVLLLLAVAVTDETIQLFTGRGAMVSDIVLDFCGGMAGLIATSILVGLGKLFFSTK